MCRNNLWQKHGKRAWMISVLVGLAIWVGAPSAADDSGATGLNEALEFTKGAAKQQRDRFEGLSFEEFEAQVYREPFEGGKYIVNGDTPVLNRKLLKEFFENQVQKDPGEQRIELIVHQVGGLDAVWNSADKRLLTYCVSTDFGARYFRVLADMDAAGAAWEAVANVDFVHAATEDDRCTADNGAVMFDVRPVDVNRRYLARAFFPNEPRSSRNVLIDESAFQLDPNDHLQLVGILRHELGHTLGFRHEHTRPDSGACFEDQDWRPVTDYDALSVMHYPQCNGLGDWTLTLTHLDQNGAACVYGPAPGFSVDAAICGDASPIARSEEFTGQSVSLGEEKQYGPFKVLPGSLFDATMQGDAEPGDPDLYVRFDAEPLRANYDCRPFLYGADENCSLDVPPASANAFVMVHGYEDGNFGLTVSYTEPAP